MILSKGTHSPCTPVETEIGGRAPGKAYLETSEGCTVK